MPQPRRQRMISFRPCLRNRRPPRRENPFRRTAQWYRESFSDFPPACPDETGTRPGVMRFIKTSSRYRGMKRAFYTKSSCPFFGVNRPPPIRCL